MLAQKGPKDMCQKIFPKCLNQATTKVVGLEPQLQLIFGTPIIQNVSPMILNIQRRQSLAFEKG